MQILQLSKMTSMQRTQYTSRRRYQRFMNEVNLLFRNDQLSFLTATIGTRNLQSFLEPWRLLPTDEFSTDELKELFQMPLSYAGTMNDCFLVVQHAFIGFSHAQKHRLHSLCGKMEMWHNLF